MTVFEILEEVNGKKYNEGSSEWVRDAMHLIKILWKDNQILIDELENK